MIINFIKSIDIFNYIFASEVFLTVSALLILLLGVKFSNKSTKAVSIASVIILIISIFITLSIDQNSYNPINKFYLINDLLSSVKIILIVGTIISLLLYIGHLNYNLKNSKTEYPILLIFSLVGMMIMISSKDFITLYLGLELQSLAIYILVSLNTSYIKSSEAGLKYFVLGSLGTGIFLYGVSFIYGFSSSIFFIDIASSLSGNANLGILMGMIFVFIALFFKISAAPFHMWTPDVYEGAPTPVVSYIATVPKVAAFIVLFRILTELFISVYDDWILILQFVAVMSLIVGALGAIRQNNLKRLLAYSSINHVGFVLLAVIAFKTLSAKAVLIYLIIYILLTFAAFAFLMLIKQAHNSADESNKKHLEDIRSYSGLLKSMPMLAIAMAITMLSMAGIPPFAGFFAKFYIFKSLILGEFYYLAIIGAVTSIISVYYYLRIIKIMFFDEEKETYNKQTSSLISFVFAILVIINIAFFFLFDYALNFIEYL